jgi:circadian clock protein KaiB
MSALPIPAINLQFCLYLAGPMPAASSTLAALEELRVLGYVFELEIVDITIDPARAETDRVIATPTLAKLSPHPMRRVMGDLANVPRLLQLLQIS